LNINENNADCGKVEEISITSEFQGSIGKSVLQSRVEERWVTAGAGNRPLERSEGWLGERAGREFQLFDCE
jgi:hypothetical protein